MKALKGNIIYTKQPNSFEVYKKSYLVENEGRVVGIYDDIPKELSKVEVIDHGDCLIVPGFVDLHFHAPQFQNIGLGLDEELLPWLEKYTFPEEAKYGDEEYAQKYYSSVARALWKNGTTRVVLFSSIHENGTYKLMDVLDKAGIGAYVGKVNMDRNSPDFYVEDTDESLSTTRRWVENTKDKYRMVKPIITPRFVPSCTEKMMSGLADIAREYDLKIQSHLSENEGEVAWVKELHPDLDSYAAVYDEMGLLNENTVMAHTVFCSEEEINLLKSKNSFAAHCPNANYNLSSGIMPVRKFMNKGVKVGLGSDVGAGHDVGIFKVMNRAIQASKMKWIENSRSEDSACLSTSEAFYLGTKGGGEFFGKVGSFEEGFEFDALVIDDECLGDNEKRTLEERLQRFIYCGDDRNIIKRYISGKDTLQLSL